MNGQNGLIGVESGALPDLGNDSVAPTQSATAEPTLQGLDRRHWPVVVLRNPPGQVEHQPSYFEAVLIAKGPARNTALAPTTDTVLEGPSDGGSLLAEAAVAPFIFAGELVLVPIRAIGDPPWAVHRAPPALPPSPSHIAPTDWRWVESQP